MHSSHSASSSRTVVQPPSPPGVPLAGSAFDAIRDPLELFLRTSRELGDVVMFRMLETRYVLLSDPDAIRHVLLENAKGYEKSRNYAGLRVLLGQGLLTSEGDQWRRQRKLAQPAFHRERIANHADIMVAYTKRMLETWRDGQTLDVQEAMMRVTLEIRRPLEPVAGREHVEFRSVQGQAQLVRAPHVVAALDARGIGIEA